MTKTGRPTKYKPEYADQAAKLCKLGATNPDLADFFNVGITTVERWIAAHPEFREALVAGKDEADARVERSLYQKAVGYQFDTVKIFMPAGANEPVYAPYREIIPPSDTACIFWLKNRKPEEWRDKGVGSEDNPLHIKGEVETRADEFTRRIAGLAAREDS